MNDLLSSSTYFGGVITILTYLLGAGLQKKTGKSWLNPILISVILTIGLLLISRVSCDTYQQGAKYISYLLTPATVCLAVPLYEQLQLLKKNWLAILCGILSGVLVSLTSVLLLSKLLGFTHAEYITFLPKSITSAIGMEVSRELGGFASLTVTIILLTGILGNVSAKAVLGLFHITDRIARGIAIGTSSHAIGTGRALEMGEVEGAMSSLSIVVSALMTVAFSLVFSSFH